MHIVGLTGFIGSGKDTVGDFFVECGYEKVSFADKLKDGVAVIFGWDRELVEGDTKESREWREMKDAYWSDMLGYEVTPRSMLQRFGTDACRNVVGVNIWVGALIRSLDPTKKYICTDVRFPNEIAAIRSVAGKLIRIRRGNDPIWYNLAYSENQIPSVKLMSKYHPEVHYSEWAWVGTEFDYVISNDYDIGVLEDDTLNIIKHIEKSN